MENNLVVAFAAFLTGIVAAVIAALLRKAMSSRERKLISIDPDGKEEIITVPADSSENEIEERILRSIRIEKNVADALASLEKINQNLKFHKSKRVDFIASYGGKKIAIEVKVDPKHFNMSQIHRYFSAEPNIDYLLIASPEKLTGRLRDQLERIKRHKPVRYVEISETPAAMEDKIGAELNLIADYSRG